MIPKRHKLIGKPLNLCKTQNPLSLQILKEGFEDINVMINSIG